MPFSVQSDPDTGIAVATGSGALGLEDAREGAQAVWKCPGWSGRAVVWDFRSAQLEFPTPAIREFAKFILENQPSAPPLRIAIVTARDLDFGLARMFEVFRKEPPTEVHVFRDFGDAVAWARLHDS
jgi:hypothetical protein